MIIFSGTIVKKLGSISRWFKPSLLSIDMRYQGSELPNEDVWEVLLGCLTLGCLHSAEDHLGG